MLLEDTHAHKIVHELSQLILNVTETILQNIIFPGSFQGILEYNEVSCE